MGVWWNSSFLAMRRASGAGKAAYRLAMVWVFRLSSTTRTTPTSGYSSSTRMRIWWAKSTLVRRSVTATWRRPARGSTLVKTLPVPLCSYS